LATAKKKKAAPPAPARRAAVGRGEARDDTRTIKVRATALGYYDDERKRVGDVFEISSARHPARYPLKDVDGKKHPKAGQENPRSGELQEFSDKWMEFVDPETPVRTTTSQAALNRETHRVAQEKAGVHVPEDNAGDGTDVL
jgi:hypothetical protein